MSGQQIIDHWMTFGTFSEQRYFVYPRPDTYKGVFINANMAAYAPSGLASFLMEKTISEYLIDPQTHAFQHDPTHVTSNKGEVKKSIRNLANQYTDLINNNVGKRPLLPNDFNAPDQLEELVTKCIDFQINFLSSEMVNNDVNKYLERTQEELHPYAVVAPYFFMDDVSIDDWLSICCKSAEITKEKEPQKKVFASLAISQDILLDENLINKISECYQGIDLNGYIIWIDDFDEAAAGIKELQGLLNLANKLKNGNNNIEIINRYGGYFSILAAGILGNNTFSGIAHGPEFGEYRAIVPVGGGIPIAKYYIPLLHQRINYRDAVTYFNKLGYLQNHESFHRNVCDCQTCLDIINGDINNFTKFGDSNTKQIKRGSGIVSMQYPKNETKEICLKHYLKRKEIEYQFSATASKQQLLENLQKGIDEYKPVAGLNNVTHLSRWKKIFDNISL